MYVSEVLLDVLDAIDISPEDLPKMPAVKMLDPEELLKNKNALVALTAGLLGITLYLLATKTISNKEEKKTQSPEME